MANIKSFPNNQDEYIGAEDVMRWHHGRTSGVFGADNNAAVAPVLDAMAVTVSDGIGWITNEIGFGVVWWVDKEAQSGAKLQLDVDMADAVLSRIDRVVVSWQTTNYVALPEVVILKGTPASAPTAPALTNNSMVRQISLASIRIPAGATSINAAMITDERLDASVCGIVTEKVGVDTSVMQAQFEAFWANNVADFEDYMARQKAAWERFFQDATEDSVFPVPALEDAGKAVLVNETGDGYTLEEIQTNIPVTSNPEEDVEIWIDPDDTTIEEAHVNDKNNPHGVTIAQIGAAPAGYGLGETAARYVDSPDLITNSGFYRSLAPDGVNTARYICVTLSERGKSIIGFSETNNGEIFTRNMAAGAWKPWEWVNPPMILGVEYRTTERHDGKVVYCKAINFGTLPESTNKTVAHGITGKTKNLRFAVATKGSSRMLDVTGISDLLVDDTNIDIQTDRSLSYASVVFTLWYLKD